MQYNVNRTGSGFLLIELLIALFLIATLSVVMGGMCMQALTAQKKSLNLIKAVELATYCLEQRTFNDVKLQEIEEGFSIEYTQVKDARLPDLAWIECTVFWKDSGQNTSLTLKKGIVS